MARPTGLRTGEALLLMSTTCDGTPAADGFRMPGEFEPHAGCWMLWPERPDNWRNGGKPAQQAFVQVASAIAQFEPVSVGVSAQQFANARATLPATVRVVEMAHDDAWMRDVGPTIVVDGCGERRGVDWRFNAWGGLHGGLYFPWDQDDLVACKVLEIERLDRYRAPLILEGGAIHVDGEGTLLTTEECLLNPNRNADLGREKIEALLCAYLGVQKVIWLGDGVHVDETDGHVDNLCCFARPGEVILTWTEDRSDPQYRISRDAYERLMDARDAQGRRFKVHKLVQTGPLAIAAEEARGIDVVEGTRARRAGDRMAASYVNFYLANGAVVMPLLDSARDRAAAQKLRRIFPERRVVGVPAREILLGGGNIHCITQQIPAARPHVARSGGRELRVVSRSGAARRKRGRRAA
ncbi:MAG TPA: agmatine deiminase [Steroidobacteraceae bacterium]|nr:agmatine deiminase [Steroidobacteraceae bacterium]